jgi:hypothetical protein
VNTRQASAATTADLTSGRRSRWPKVAARPRTDSTIASRVSTAE